MTVTAPGMSYPRRIGLLLSVTKRVAAMAVTMAMGTLISSVQRQDAYCVRTPPRMRPMAAPPPAMLP